MSWQKIYMPQILDMNPYQAIARYPQLVIYRVKLQMEPVFYIIETDGVQAYASALIAASEMQAEIVSMTKCYYCKTTGAFRPCM